MNANYTLFAQTNAPAATQTTAAQATAVQPAPGAQAPEQPQPGMMDGMFPIIMIVVIVVMFYLMYRGQKKEQKKRQEMIMGIKKDDKIRTIGGIHGVVTEVHDEYFKIRIASNTEIEVDKGAVNSVVTGEAEKK